MLIFFLYCSYGFANMASPIAEGTKASTVLSSRKVDIISERITVILDKNFSIANYTIEYWIKSDTIGMQIPLLFHALDYEGDFKIWLDQNELYLQEIPKEYKKTEGTPFSYFESSFEKSARKYDNEYVSIAWEPSSSGCYELNDLKYFEANLDSGMHQIKIQYQAKVWLNQSYWVNEYSFRYSLSPAKHWRSFGDLKIIVDATNFDKELSSNLNEPHLGKLDSIAIWNFSELPELEFFEIVYTPKISPFAKIISQFGPFNIMLLMALAIFLFHWMFVKLYRKYKPLTKYSWVVIIGSLALPFFMLINFVFAHAIIDYYIGPEAASQHGYTFLMVIFYPLLMPIYWLIMWGIDRRIKKKYSNKINEETSLK